MRRENTSIGRHVPVPLEPQSPCWWSKACAQNRRERQAAGNVSRFEATADTRHLPAGQRQLDPKLAVKEYVRPSEGREEASNLRPIAWLVRTTDYLLCDLFPSVLATDQQDLPLLHAFISDRLQAVRKDLTIQRCRGIDATNIYQQTVRYHILVGYMLAAQVPPEFDFDANLGRLGSALTTLLKLYTDGDNGSLDALDVDEFRSYRLLVAAVAVTRSSRRFHADDSLLSLLTPRDLARLEGECSPATQRALTCLKAMAAGNPAAMLRVLCTSPLRGVAPRVHRLQCCLLHAMLPVVRVAALQLWAVSLRRAEVMPMVELCRLLLFENEEHAARFCDLCGISLEPSASADATRGVVLKNCCVQPPEAGTLEDLRPVVALLQRRQDAVVLGLEGGDLDAKTVLQLVQGETN